MFSPSSLRPFVPSSRRLPAFTLVEMVVVVAVVLILLGLLLPAATALWRERKTAEAENMVQGLLMTTRARALQNRGMETGFLAFVDSQGAQHLVAIEQAAPPAELPIAKQLAWQNIFVIRGDPDQVLPSPMRIVPRYAVESEQTKPDAGSHHLFSAAELANNDFEQEPPVGNQAQRHRNFFSVVFSTEGHLLVNRDVLIQDPDLVQLVTDVEDSGVVRRGDRTGLRVGPGPPDPPTTTTYYPVRAENRGSEANSAVPIDLNDPTRTFGFLVTDQDDVALSFPSVDGLLVYDDSLFAGLPAGEKREFLLRTGQPLYISRWTGAVVRGPVGEVPEVP